MRQEEIYKSFITEITGSAPSGWESIELSFEYFPWNGSFFEKYQCFSFSRGAKLQFDPSLETFDELIDIHEAMSNEVSEPWTHCQFKIDSAGKYNIEFKYGMPPLTKEMLKNAGEI